MSPSDAPYSPPPRGPHERQRSDVQGDRLPSERQSTATPSAKARGDDTAAERSNEARGGLSDGPWPGAENYRDRRWRTPSDVNYKDRYEPDPYGEELGPKARVWSVYNDEAWRADKEQAKRLNGTLDVLLVFAGLFSAVITTFVAQSSLKLEPDYTKITASLVYELVLVQRAIRMGSPVSDVPSARLSFESDTYRATDLWVNGLWLTSLVLALVTALASVLAKQWIQYFTSPGGSTPREHAHIRQYRFDNFKRWNVPLIIGFLPVLLTFALLLFLAGLAVYTTPGNPTISYIIVGFSAAITLVYAVSIVLPIFVTHCAYKTAISDYIMIIPHLLYSIASRKGGVDIPLQLKKSFFEEREKADAQRQSIPLTEAALDWLYSSSSNASAATISLQAAFAHLTRRDREDLNIQSAFMRSIGVILLPSWQQLLQDLRWSQSEGSREPLLSVYEPWLRVALSRGNDRMERLWRSPTQTERWRSYNNDLGELETGLREVALFIMHVRDLSQMNMKPRYLYRDVQDKVEVLIPLLPDLLLHPVVWRDLEVAILYCLSLHEVKEAGLSGRTESLELPLKSTGDPLEHAPIFLAKYAEARRGKTGGDIPVEKGDEILAKDMRKLQSILPQLIDQAKDEERPIAHARRMSPLTRYDTRNMLSIQGDIISEATQQIIADTQQQMTQMMNAIRRLVLVRADRPDESESTATTSDHQEHLTPDNAHADVVGAVDVDKGPSAVDSIGTRTGRMPDVHGDNAVVHDVDPQDAVPTDPASEGRVGDTLKHTRDVTLDSCATGSSFVDNPGPSEMLAELPKPEAADEAPALPAPHARHSVRWDTPRSPLTDSC